MVNYTPAPGAADPGGTRGEDVQAGSPDDPDAERAMETGKVTGILAKVSQKIAIDPATELRIEYGNEHFPPVVFHIEKIEAEAATVAVSLRSPVLACKLEERGGSCARPEPAQASEGACGPGSGCC